MGPECTLKQLFSFLRSPEVEKLWPGMHLLEVVTHTKIVNGVPIYSSKPYRERRSFRGHFSGYFPCFFISVDFLDEKCRDCSSWSSRTSFIFLTMTGLSFHSQCWHKDRFLITQTNMSSRSIFSYLFCLGHDLIWGSVWNAGWRISCCKKGCWNVERILKIWVGIGCVSSDPLIVLIAMLAWTIYSESDFRNKISPFICSWKTRNKNEIKWNGIFPQSGKSVC